MLSRKVGLLCPPVIIGSIRNSKDRDELRLCVPNRDAELDLGLREDEEADVSTDPASSAKVDGLISACSMLFQIAN